MRIAISTSVVHRGKTGIAQYVFALARALLPHAREHPFTLFVLEEDLPLFDFAAGAMTLVPVSERFRPALKNIAWHQAALPRLLRERRIEVCHVPSYRRLLWPTPCAMVATIHDLAPFHVAGKYDVARMFYDRVIVRALARRQDEIIAISQNTARDIEQFFDIPVAEQNVIYNGIDHERFQPGDNAQARAGATARWRLDRPFFLYISRLEHPGKNHVRVIEAFNCFKTATRSDNLLVFGGSDWHGADVIRATAQQSPFASDIRFLGFVADAVLPTLYRVANAVVYPSLYEGFGFPPIEAMACGCPAISSTRGSLGEVVADAALIVNPESVDEIAAALQRVTTDAACRDQLREAGFRNARRFDWQRNAAEVLRVYAKALGTR
ncbi:MAG: glycosyltransferase family 1 protein [Verrucomicrobia bacterium]|nr:glycosyltransferase family 1 protein [Verrucomicrobiota bacterium]